MQGNDNGLPSLLNMMIPSSDATGNWLRRMGSISGWFADGKEQRAQVSHETGSRKRLHAGYTCQADVIFAIAAKKDQAENVMDWCRMRGENRIKELKVGFGMEQWHTICS